MSKQIQRRASQIVISGMLLLGSGCAIDQHKSSKLGSAGKEVSQNMGAYYQKLVELARGFTTNDILARGRVLWCNPRVYKNKQALKKCREQVRRAIFDYAQEDEQIITLITHLNLRMKFSKSMGNVYDAFVELSKKNVRPDIEQKIGELTNSLEALAKVSNPKAIIPKFTKKIFIEVAGIAVDVWRARMLREVNSALLQRVTFALKIFKRDRLALEGAYKLLLRTKYNAVRALWLAGKLRMDKAVERAASGFAVVPIKGEKGLIYQRGDPIGASFTILLRREYLAQLAAFRTASAQIISALENLEMAHKKYGEGAEVDLATALVAVGRLRALIEAYDLR